MTSCLQKNLEHKADGDGGKTYEGECKRLEKIYI